MLALCKMILFCNAHYLRLILRCFKIISGYMSRFAPDLNDLNMTSFNLQPSHVIKYSL